MCFDSTLLFFFAFAPLRAQTNEPKKGKKFNASAHKAYAPLAFHYGLNFWASPPKWNVFKDFYIPNNF
jgi:choline-glycine betaine transporter